MRLDDLARQAADQAREQAARTGSLDPEAYRQARERRTQQRAFLVSGAFVTAALVVAIVVSPPEEDLAAPTTTTTLPAVVTTLPGTTTTTIGPEPSTGPPPLGAGWEELDPGPIAGRYRTAAVWTDYGLFVWGGHDNYTQETPSNTLFYGNGFLYDPASETWRAVATPGQEFFEVGEARAVSMGDRVFVYGHRRAPNSGSTAIYDIEADEWTPVVGEFGSIALGTPVVWTDEYLVAPESGLGYDPATQHTFLVPVPPSGGDAAVHSPKRYHWTGAEVLAIGSGPVYSWLPGTDDWRTLDDPPPPVPIRARDSVWTDEGLLVVNYQMASAFFIEGANVEWRRFGDLPLRFYECLPEAVAAGGIPVVRMCSGLAIWDRGRSSWMPVPDDGEYVGTLVGAEGAIYTVGGTFRRFEIEHAGVGGSIIPPPAVPIGVAELDIPSGWELKSSFAPVQSPEGFIPEDETIGLVFQSVSEADGLVTCRVASTYHAHGWLPPADADRIGSIAVGPTGTLAGTAYWVTGDEDDEYGNLFAIPTGTSDTVTIRCSGTNRDALSGHAAAFGGLRTPFELDPPAVIGTGWEEVADSPVAGRMRVAATWTGSELFVWGGHDGYSQETPGSMGVFDPTVFHHEAHLFDPTTGVWRMASDPPDGLCPLAESTATWIGDRVLVRGGHSLTPDCVSGAATYDPVGDSWTVLEGRFFDQVPFRAEVVWIVKSLAAPVFGLAWVPDEDGGETIEIPIVPDAGSQVGSPTMFHHWGGERITAVGAGDIYWLVPGADTWESVASLGIGEAGRRSLLTEHGLFVVTRDGEVARVADWAEINLGENLPLRLSECDAFLVAAGDLPVAQVGCSGMAIWDPERGFWVPIPMDILSGWAWQPSLVGTDDAIYSFGEKVLRYQIERLGDGSVANPPTIPVGVMQLDIPPGFWLRSTVGTSQVTWPDGSFGEVSAFAFDAPRGTCQVAARYGGPELTVDAGVIVEGTEVPLPWFTYHDGEWDAWVIVVGGGVDSIWINCDSDADAELLIDGFWLP